jgi:hypothetical protein
MSQQVVHDPGWVTAERAVVVPPFAEVEVEITHRGTLDRDLDVVPWRSPSIHGSHLLRLDITTVDGVVPPAVAQVDATDKRNVPLGRRRVARNDELLMVGAAQADTLVQEDLAAGCVHLHTEVTVFLGAEAEPVRVRAPEESLDSHAAPRGVSQDGANLGLV